MVHGYSAPEGAPPTTPWYMRLGLLVPVIVMFLMKIWLEAMQNRKDRKAKAAAVTANKKNS
jgi:hypothetical protein